MTIQRKLGIAAILIWTLAATIFRALRAPNDFAKVHWLLDYRFGFIKRGLVGTLFSFVTSVLHIRVTETLIWILSGIALLVFCLLSIYLALRVIQCSNESTNSVLIALVFLSSPFFVMSAHLIGYYDNLILMLAVGSVGLLLTGRMWLAISLQILAIMVHENALLVSFPVFCLAWLLVNSKRYREETPLLSPWPLLLPVCAFGLVAISQTLFVAPDFKQAFTAHLSHFQFIGRNRAVLAPTWLSTSFQEYMASPQHVLAPWFSVAMWGLMLPTTLVILFHILRRYRIRLVTVEALVLFGVCFAPQLLHMIAWDTARIWTFTIVCSFLALWTYSELFPVTEDSATINLLCLTTLVVNVVAVTPLMDGEAEQLSLPIRVCLFLPIIAVCLILLCDRDGVSMKERLQLRGVPVLQLLFPWKRSHIPKEASQPTEIEAP